MRIKLIQMNSTVGAFEENYHQVASAIAAADSNCLVVFPECVICGYPQQDLLDYPAFGARAEQWNQKLISEFSDRSFIFGSVERNQNAGRPMRNTAYFVRDGKLVAKYFKRLLPSYDVFDEDRFFEPGRESLIVPYQGKNVAITICEDIWGESLSGSLQNRYQQSPLKDASKADGIINLSASPFEYEKVKTKREMIRGLAKKYSRPLVYVNSVGANDGIIFDGRSYLFSAKGEMIESAKAFESESLEVDLFQEKATKRIELRDDPIQNIYEAVMMGIRDYCQKVGFKQVLLGLSGGIDSAVLAALAEDAIGPKNLTVVTLPSRYTSKESKLDALEQIEASQLQSHELDIEASFSSILNSLSVCFEGRPADLAEENLQSRIRGTLLMALSNKFGHLLLTTGNKSELATGYCTLYGDMNGGLAPISDVFKTQVYALGREANRRKKRIPERVFSKPPTAELRENQTDQEFLPPYDKLDEILQKIIEGFQSFDELVAEGYPAEKVQEILNLVAKNEYKRFQMPLGLKVSSKAFGVGRRLPLVHRFFE